MVVAAVVMATIAVVAVVTAAVGEQAAELLVALLFLALTRQSLHRAIPFCSLTLATVWTKP